MGNSRNVRTLKVRLQSVPSANLLFSPRLFVSTTLMLIPVACVMKVIKILSNPVFQMNAITRLAIGHSYLERMYSRTRNVMMLKVRLQSVPSAKFLFSPRLIVSTTLMLIHVACVMKVIKILRNPAFQKNALTRLAIGHRYLERRYPRNVMALMVGLEAVPSAKKLFSPCLSALSIHVKMTMITNLNMVMICILVNN